jgi:uncharacterized protein YdeI (YjbR/CyaY-like superfamily)
MESTYFTDAQEWESWLANHHELRGGAWLKIAKKNSGRSSVTVSEALDVALCYGWIDSQRRSYDETYFLQRYSPRRPGSSWSKVNVERADALIAAGRMRAPGLAEISTAMADGRWDAAYESQRSATVPPDLAAALERNDQAREFFESLGKTDRYIVLLRLMTARSPEVRAARLLKVVATLAAGDRVQ